jgi:transposase InsO family protein
VHHSPSSRPGNDMPIHIPEACALPINPNDYESEAENGAGINSRSGLSAGAAKRKSKNSHFYCNRWPFSDVTGTLWHSINAPSHSRHDTAPDCPGSIQSTQRTACRTPDRLACLAAEVDVEDGDIAPRLKPERFCYRRCQSHDLVTGRSKRFACTPSRLSVPTSRATRVTSEANERSCSTIVLIVSFSCSISPRTSTVISLERSPLATAVVMSAIGRPINRRHVQRLMGLMGIAALGPRPRTSKPAPGHRIFPYLLRGMTIDRPNQVWAADITYIPLGRGFLYLVAIMDWASRAVLSWRLSNTMDMSFCVATLEEALLRSGKPQIFNIDQGSQFTSTAFDGPASKSRWMAVAAGWTTSSSSGCGAASSTRMFISRAMPMVASCTKGLRIGSPYTTTAVLTRRSAIAPRWRSGATAPPQGLWI